MCQRFCQKSAQIKAGEAIRGMVPETQKNKAGNGVRTLAMKNTMMDQIIPSTKVSLVESTMSWGPMPTSFTHDVRYLNTLKRGGPATVSR